MDKQLIKKYFSGKCNEAEFKEVMNYFMNESSKTEALNDIEASWYDYSSAEQFKHHQLSNIKSKLNQNLEPKQRFIAWGQIMKVAASLLLIAVFGFVTYQYLNQENVDEVVVVEPVQTIIKENPKGQKLKISLKDGSSIMLNAESSVVYNSGFGVDNRIIKLNGEAFFEVAENRDLPFKVQTGSIEVVALGTSFNVQNYQEMEVEKVALATGKVKISSVANDTVVLDPGEMVHYKNREFGKKRIFDALAELGWKDGKLIFKNSSLTQVVQNLERWYGVDIQVMNSDQHVNWSYTGSYNNVSLENVLNGISFTKGITFEINGENVKVNL